MITNRSPSVSRNTFHSLFRGPTIGSSQSWIVSQDVGFRREEIYVRRITLIDAHAPRIELLFLRNGNTKQHSQKHKTTASVASRKVSSITRSSANCDP